MKWRIYLNPIAIITALKKESNAILCHLCGLEDCSTPEFFIVKGWFQRQVVFMAVSGIGRKKVLSAAKVLIPICNPTVLISCGWAGALDPCFRLGDIVLVKEVMGPPEGQYPSKEYARRGETDPTWRKNLEACFKEKEISFQTASLLTVDSPAATIQEKSFLFSESGAGIVDMETSELMAFTEKHSIPFLGLRSISDTARMEFDAQLLKYHVQKKRTRFLLRALTNPAALARLIHFKYGMGNANRCLEKAAPHFMRRPADQM